MNDQNLASAYVYKIDQLERENDRLRQEIKYWKSKVSSLYKAEGHIKGDEEYWHNVALGQGVISQ